VQPASEGSAQSFLADWGVGRGAAAVLSAASPAYPFAVPRLLENLAVRLINQPTGAPGSTLVFDLLKNGIPIFTIVWTMGDPIGNLPIAVGTNLVGQGSRLDLRVIATGITNFVDVSATVGIG